MTLILTLLACTTCGKEDWYVVPVDCLGTDPLDCLDCGHTSLIPILGQLAVPVAHGSEVEADWYMRHPEAILREASRL